MIDYSLLAQERSLREQLVYVSNQLVFLGLNRGTSGNCSARLGKYLLITPSGVPAKNLTPEAIVKLDYSGNIIGSGKPSSEWQFHCDILSSRPDINAVVHTHSLHAASQACIRKEIPAFHYMIAVGGGDNIRCAAYETFGSKALSIGAIEALKNRFACLLANHGLIALGSDLNSAFALAIEVETLCEQYTYAQLQGGPHILSKSQMNEVLEKFNEYGLRKNSDAPLEKNG
jgi:L-fuculose-phosphate aldolase